MAIGTEPLELALRAIDEQIERLQAARGEIARLIEQRDGQTAIAPTAGDQGQDAVTPARRAEVGATEQDKSAQKAVSYRSRAARGGKARALALSAEVRREIAAKGAKARWAKNRQTESEKKERGRPAKVRYVVSQKDVLGILRQQALTAFSLTEERKSGALKPTQSTCSKVCRTRGRSDSTMPASGN